MPVVLITYTRTESTKYVLNIQSELNYSNLKKNLYNCKANIYFNQQCLKKHLTSIYAKIKVPNTSPPHKYTQYKIPSIHILYSYFVKLSTT
jgi:hypothetical protein